MQKIMLSGLVVLTAIAGVAQAAPTAKKSVRVVSSAKALTSAEKASVTGMDCGCPDPVSKPGYGFGAPVEHYGPPGQGFNPNWTWRQQMAGGGANGGPSDYTPKGNALPPRAFVVNPR